MKNWIERKIHIVKHGENSNGVIRMRFPECDDESRWYCEWEIMGLPGLKGKVRGVDEFDAVIGCLKFLDALTRDGVIGDARISVFDGKVTGAAILS